MSGTTPEDFSGMNLVDFLGQLEPLVEPTPVSWWPQTAGWTFFGVFLLLGLAVLTWRYLRKRHADRYRREALAELTLLEAMPRQSTDPDLICDVAALIRRTAMACYGREGVAAIHGEQWLEFLDRKAKRNLFAQTPAAALARAPYDGIGDTEQSKSVLAAARIWILRHHA